MEDDQRVGVTILQHIHGCLNVEQTKRTQSGGQTPSPASNSPWRVLRSGPGAAPALRRVSGPASDTAGASSCRLILLLRSREGTRSQSECRAIRRRRERLPIHRRMQLAKLRDFRACAPRIVEAVVRLRHAFVVLDHERGAEFVVFLADSLKIGTVFPIVREGEGFEAVGRDGRRLMPTCSARRFPVICAPSKLYLRESERSHLSNLT